LIQIIRGLGELDSFQQLIEYKKSYSPMGVSNTKLPKRIRNHKKQNISNRPKWGDEK
jgi:hypothetical protein